MSSERIERYLDDVQRVLTARGIRNVGFLDEAREHLADAVDAAVERGLTRDAAEEDALEKFGPPDLVAAGCEDEEAHMALDRIISPLKGLLAGLWRRKWRILVPTAAIALLTAVGSSFFMPMRYRSASAIVIVPGDRWARHVEEINTQILTAPRLEQIITDFDLYPRERRAMSLAEVAARMRGDIAIDLLTGGRQEKPAGLKVSFVSSTPKTAMKVAERLTSLFIEENLRRHEEQWWQRDIDEVGIDSQINYMRREILQYETELERLRERRSNAPLSQADVIPFDVMKETYRTLLAKRFELRIANRVGEQWKVVEPPRLPDRPLGPTRAQLSIAGALAGFAIGLILLAWPAAPTNHAAVSA